MYCVRKSGPSNITTNCVKLMLPSINVQEYAECAVRVINNKYCLPFLFSSYNVCLTSLFILITNFALTRTCSN